MWIHYTDYTQISLQKRQASHLSLRVLEFSLIESRVSFIPSSGCSTFATTPSILYGTTQNHFHDAHLSFVQYDVETSHYYNVSHFKGNHGVVIKKLPENIPVYLLYYKTLFWVCFTDTEDLHSNIRNSYVVSIIHYNGKHLKNKSVYPHFSVYIQIYSILVINCYLLGSSRVLYITAALPVSALISFRLFCSRVHFHNVLQLPQTTHMQISSF